MAKWMRPGFELGLAMQAICKKSKKAKAIMMGQHGFISWADDDKDVTSPRWLTSSQASQFIEAEISGQQRRRRRVWRCA